MTKRITLAPVGAGKTEIALQTLIDTLSSQPFAKIWVLLATKRQEDAFRQRLIEYNDGRHIYFSVEFFNFYELNRRLLDIVGQPARCLSETSRIRLLRSVVETLAQDGQIPLYERIAVMPGFVRIMADLIYELKQNQIRPETFIEAATTQKDRELSLIYARYQDRLQAHDLVDREGEGWLALARTAADTRIADDLALLIVDGYDQFTWVQAEMLSLLSDRADETLITLTTVPGREDTIGRRFATALASLRKHHRLTEGVIIETLDGTAGRPTELSRVIENVFRPDVMPQAAQDTVRFVEAPDAGAEVGAVLRRVKALILDGCPPDDILITLRDWELYQPHFIALSREYGVPLALHYGEKLVDNPLIATLLNILELAAGDFRRRDLLDVLRSPYVNAPGLGLEQIEILEQISQTFSVTGGTDLWLEALKNATKPTVNDYGDRADPILKEDVYNHLFHYLSEFFEHVKPHNRATVEQHVAWLEELIGPDPVREEDEAYRQPPYTLDVVRMLREAVDEHTLARDLMAIDALKWILRGLLTAESLIANLENTKRKPQSVEWEVFNADLLSAIGIAALNPQPSRSGRVLVTTAANARGLPHQHVSVLGLSEGIFPAKIGEDPLYLDSERLRLKDLEVHLRTQAERATDDGIFYELLCLPRETLTLSRPTTQGGQPWPESHLWRALIHLFDPPNLTRLRAGQVVSAGEAASLAEVSLAVSDGLNQPQPDAAVVELYNWMLQSRPVYWDHIRLSRKIESKRLSKAAHDQYSGRLENRELIAHARAGLDETRYWSASQFNDYGVCPFRFFAKRLLKLEQVGDPEAGMDVLQRGSIYHAILEMTYRSFRGQDLFITPDNLQTALDILHTEATDILNTAPEDYGFRPTALWDKDKAMLLKKLELLVRADFAEDNPIADAFSSEARQPYRLEAPFGREGTAVTLDLPESGTIKINGLIDRMDRVGDSLIVLDYKSGKTNYPLTDMEEGRNFQMVVYVLAAKAILEADTRKDKPTRVLGGAFFKIGDGKVSGVLEATDSDVFEAALDHLDRYIMQMRRGDFAVIPNKKSDNRCIRYCEYDPLCRLCGLEFIKP